MVRQTLSSVRKLSGHLELVPSWDLVPVLLNQSPGTGGSYPAPNPTSGTQGLERAVAGPLWQNCSLQGWALHNFLPNTGKGPSEDPKFQLGGTLRRLCA